MKGVKLTSRIDYYNENNALDSGIYFPTNSITRPVVFTETNRRSKIRSLLEDSNAMVQKCNK